MRKSLYLGIVPLTLTAVFAAAQQVPNPAVPPPETNTNYIDEDGTAHITRVIPLPESLSPEARKFILDAEKRVPTPAGQQVRPAQASGSQGTITQQAGGAWSKLLPNQITDSEIAGVPVHTITPDGMPEANLDKVLINLHGGAFRTNSAASSLGESIPIAGYAKIKVVAVLYRGLPKDPFPAAVDDVVAVYKELLKTYKPQHIGIFGSSAGGGLTAEVTAKLKQLGIPLPGALGIFTARGDFAREGDTRALFEIGGYAGPVPGLREERKQLNDPDYVGKTDPRDPILSPIYSDLHGFPPSLFISSTRDIELSGTVNLHRAFVLAGVDARLVVWEGLPHLFWVNASLPESIEATHVMADFFVKQLGK